MAQTERNLYFLVFWVAVAVFVLVEGLLVVALVRFRQRTPQDRPRQTHGNTRLEIGWTIVPAVLLAVLAVPTLLSIFSLSAAPSGHPLRVNVTGHQFWWEYQYPDYGVVTANELHIPVGRKVEFSLNSADVIHSFWVPRLAGKQDVVPGRTNHLSFSASRAGTYRGQCVEFCGFSHANMRLRVIAQPESEFLRWVQAQKQPATAPSGLAAAGQQIFLNTALPGGYRCAVCHTVNGTAAQGRVGPDLTHFASRTTFGGSTFENTSENVAGWLHDPPAMKPGSKMPNYHLSSDEISSLVAYLEGLQ